jgi:putative ABC transport system permease protein
VVAEIALSLVLLAGAGLLVRTLAALARVDPGFRPANLVLGHLSLSPKRFPSDHELAAFYAELEERLAADRAIAAAGLISEQPLADGRMDMRFELAGARAAGDLPAAVVRSVSPGYLATVGLPLVAGRPIEARDAAATPAVALVNQRFVASFLGGGDPVGRRLRLGARGDPQYAWHTIVGVVGDLRGQALDRPPEPEVYLPLAQQTALAVTAVVRAEGAPAAAQRAVQRIANQVRPGLAVARAMTLEESLDRSLAPRRLTAGLLGCFAGVALLLAAVGIYGVVALAVSQRRREFAIRLALGARASAVTGLVLRWSGWLAATGTAIGLAGALAASRSLASLLYEVKPADLATLAAVALVLMAVALLASLAPAIRAGRTDLVRDLKSGG